MNEYEVSIIVPAFNEEERLPPFLKECLDFLINKKEYEMILVNDGSTDNTIDVMMKVAKTNSNLKIVTYKQNGGKGWAVKKGVEVANGQKIIFIDADGSIHPDQIPYMIEKLNDYDVVVGDRSSKDSHVHQPSLRKLTGGLFNLYVRILFNNNRYDNLCGFKGFRKEVAKDLFYELHDYGWVFDVELFHKIKNKGCRIYSLPLVWEHKEASKLKITDPFKMLLRLIRLRIKLRGNR